MSLSLVLLKRSFRTFLEILCSLPNIPENGKISNGFISFGYAIQTTIGFACNDGFRLEGNALITCLNSSKWSENDTACIGK